MTHCPQPASNFTSEIKIDGIFVVSSNWNIWRPKKCPSIKFPLLVIRERVTSAAKGSRFFLDYKYVYKIKLFEVCDVLVNLVFYTKEDEIVFSHILSIATRCLENAVNSLISSESYTRKIQKVENFGKGPNNVFLVCLRDFHILGEKYAQQLNQATNSNCLNFVFFSSATGQSQLLEYFLTYKLEINSYERIIELIYHVAIDTLQGEKFLFWSKEGLDTHLQRPSQQYFPNCLGKLGNFIYDIKVPLNASNFEITKLKLYNKCYSYCHDNPTPPFREASASLLFFKAATMGFRKKTKASIRKLETECQRIRKELDLLKRIIGDFSIQSSGVARLEAICSCNKFTSITDVAQFCLSQISDSHLISSTTLYGISGETLKCRCEAIFTPYINLVEMHLERLVAMIQAQPNLDFLNMTIDDIISVEAGEAVIAFMLYGRSAKTNVSPGHSYVLCKDLGLVANEFESSQNVFPELGKNRLCVDENNRLVYFPTFNFVPHLDLKGFIDSIELSKIFRLTADLSSSDNKSILCQYIVRKICQCIIACFGKYVRGVPTISKTAVVLGKLKNNVIISSLTFSRMFFCLDSCYFSYVPGVVWLRTLVTQYLNDAEISALIIQLGKTLETEIYKQKSLLFFPIHPDGNLIISCVGNSDHVKETTYLWGKALEIILDKRQSVNERNLTNLCRCMGRMNLRNLENLHLNLILIEANNYCNLNFAVVQCLIKKYYIPVFE